MWASVMPSLLRETSGPGEVAGPAALAPPHRLDPGRLGAWHCHCAPGCSRITGPTGQQTDAERACPSGHRAELASRPLPADGGAGRRPCPMGNMGTTRTSSPCLGTSAPVGSVPPRLEGRGAAQPWGRWAQSHIPRCPAPAHPWPPSPSLHFRKSRTLCPTCLPSPHPHSWLSRLGGALSQPWGFKETGESHPFAAPPGAPGQGAAEGLDASRTPGL